MDRSIGISKKKRLVLVRSGFAYVEEEDFTGILTSKFRAMLSRELDKAYKVVDAIANDIDTISPLLNHLQKKLSWCRLFNANQFRKS